MPGTGDEGTPIEITVEDQEVNPGTYTLSETGPENFEFVLIAGDTGCPTMVEDMDPFTLESGSFLTCVVYNDDDADGGGQGVFFARNSLQITVDGNGFLDESLSAHGCINVPLNQKRPCITEDSEGIGLLVVDPAFDQQGGHLASVVATVQPAGPGTFIDCHAPSGIDEHSFPGSDTVRGFVVPCSLSAGDGGIFFVDYSIIKTTIESPWESDGIDNNGVNGIDEPGEGDGLDNDMDSAVDEDPYDNIDNDMDGLLDEDP